MTGLTAYTAFARAVELGSFSAVARELGMAQSTVSKHVSALEDELKVQLFARSTRKLSPTPEAMQLYEAVQHLLQAGEAIRSSMGQARAVPSGLLRVTLPDTFGRSAVLPMLAPFLQAYPQVRLDIQLTDRSLDLIEDGIEIAVRIGELPSSTMVARPLGWAEPLVVATPRYLAQHGVPQQPLDLLQHNCLVYTGYDKGGRWVLGSGERQQVVEVNSNLGLNSMGGIYHAMLGHAGIACVPESLVRDDIAAGRVRELLPDFPITPLPINIVYPQTRALSSRAKAFVDFLTAHVATGRPLRPG